jgi:hypothetical protein
VRLNKGLVFFASLLPIAFVVPVFAASPAGAVGPDQDWVLRVGGELGQDQSRASTASLDYTQIPGALTSTGPAPSWSGGGITLEVKKPAKTPGNLGP